MSETKVNTVKTERMPMLALRGLSLFPSMLLNFDVERPMSVAALSVAMEEDRRIFLLAQKDPSLDAPNERDLYTVGTVCAIKQILRLPAGGVRVMVDGLSRARLVRIISDVDFFDTEIEILEEESIPEKNTQRTEALLRKGFELFNAYADKSNNVTKETVLIVSSVQRPGYLADYITQNVIFKPDEKQRVLETYNPIRRLELVCRMLSHELEIISMEQKLSEKLRDNLTNQQRDNVLREQMRIIQAELGEDPDAASEYETYRRKIVELHLEKSMEEKLLKDVDRLEKQPFGSAEGSVLRTYLDTCLELPWHKTTKERTDTKVARKILDDDHFGLEKVKERIIEFISVRQLAPDLQSPILSFVGPPGVGKTSIAISIAKALNRKLARLSLGGIHDEAEIRGHRKTYVGAMPGRIINAVNQAGTKNPLLLLDEIDKLGSDYRGDPAAALLEALDPEQNATFRDHFIELPFDLSDVMFITTANNLGTIPRPLLDRMEVIELSSYTDMEKLEIAKRHLIPKQRKKHGLTARQLKLTDDAIREIIACYTRESGVRVLEREIATVCRRTAAKIVAGEIKSVTLTTKRLEEFLGVKKFKPDAIHIKDAVGIVKGLAWTTCGGETLEVEVNVLPGTGKLELTGNLGDVMKESAHAAVSYIRSRAAFLGIESDFYKTKDIHIHFPEGATPKDGPSAGITMAIAVISALTGAPVRRDVAMTGEITLRGRILPIGGLREKTMAALRTGVKTVIIPAENERDLEEIDQSVRRALNFVTADQLDNILDVALDFSKRPAPEAKDKIKTAPVSQEKSHVDMGYPAVQ
jgi:ATP-dependent Lon protease